LEAVQRGTEIDEEHACWALVSVELGLERKRRAVSCRLGASIERKKYGDIWPNSEDRKMELLLICLMKNKEQRRENSTVLGIERGKGEGES
jgi:hypothetical protein